MTADKENELPLRCKCGSLKGKLCFSDGVNRCVCYCDDCRTFARFLNCDMEILDDNGGTEVIQVIQKNIDFTDGVEDLACIRLSENGLLRWYASCCNTPVGNTPANYRISTMGLIRGFIDCDDKSLDESLGPERMHVFTKYAKTSSFPKGRGLLYGIVRTIYMISKAVLRRDYRYSPFFLAENGKPVISPRVLSKEEMPRIS